MVDVEWVVLDAMGVIFKAADDVRDLLIPYLQKSDPNLSPHKVEGLYTQASLGSFPSSRFWEELGFGKDYPGIEKDYLDRCLEVDSGFYTCAQALSPSFQLGFLSNDVAEWSRYLRSKHKLDQWFKAVIVSGDVGIRKPDKGIYQELLKRISVGPSRCLVIDDRVRNLDCAGKLGFKTLAFSRDDSPREVGGHPAVGSFSEVVGLLKNETSEKLK